MGITETYLAYAEAFEESYEDDDWARIEAFFSENAVYEGDPEAQGRTAVLAKLKGAVDGFDRKMDRRSLDFQAPEVAGSVVTVPFVVTYSKTGAPDLVMRGKEIAVFEGNRIARLRDDFEPDTLKTLDEWMATHRGLLA